MQVAFDTRHDVVDFVKHGAIDRYEKRGNGNPGRVLLDRVSFMDTDSGEEMDRGVGEAAPSACYNKGLHTERCHSFWRFFFGDDPIASQLVLMFPESQFAFSLPTAICRSWRTHVQVCDNCRFKSH